jgi:hypothetical protein
MSDEIVYKVVTHSQAGSRVHFSATAGWLNTLEPLEYIEDEWTWPYIGQGPLFAFETYDLAADWVINHNQERQRELSVFRAIGQNVRPLRYMVSIRLANEYLEDGNEHDSDETMPQIVNSFWQDPFPHALEYSIQPPSGTVVCNAIKLVERLELKVIA